MLLPNHSCNCYLLIVVIGVIELNFISCSNYLIMLTIKSQRCSMNRYAGLLIFDQLDETTYLIHHGMDPPFFYSYPLTPNFTYLCFLNLFEIINVLFQSFLARCF